MSSLWPLRLTPTERGRCGAGRLWPPPGRAGPGSPLSGRLPVSREALSTTPAEVTAVLAAAALSREYPVSSLGAGHRDRASVRRRGRRGAASDSEGARQYASHLSLRLGPGAGQRRYLSHVDSWTRRRPESPERSDSVQVLPWQCRGPGGARARARRRTRSRGHCHGLGGAISTATERDRDCGAAPAALNARYSAIRKWSRRPRPAGGRSPVRERLRLSGSLSSRSCFRWHGSLRGCRGRPG